MRGTGLAPVVGALGLMGIGLGIAGAAVQTAAVESVPAERTGSAAGIYSTARYMGSVAGSTALAIVFADSPRAGEATPFVRLFAGLVLVALLGAVANSRIAGRVVLSTAGVARGTAAKGPRST